MTAVFTLCEKPVLTVELPDPGTEIVKPDWVVPMWWDDQGGGHPYGDMELWGYIGFTVALVRDQLARGWAERGNDVTRDHWFETAMANLVNLDDVCVALGTRIVVRGGDGQVLPNPSHPDEIPAAWRNILK
jgi:hypothetical protein